VQLSPGPFSWRAVPLYQPLLAHVRHCAPYLERLHVSTPAGDFLHDITDIILNLSSLRELSLPLRLSKSAFTHLASLPSLEYLSIRAEYSDDEQPTFLRPSFPKLRWLKLSIQNLRWVAELLSSMTTSNLRYIDCEFLYYDRRFQLWEDLVPFLAFLARHPSRNGIKCISLMVSSGTADTSLVPSLDFLATFGPLLDIPYLETVRVAVGCRFITAGDADYLRFIQSLPNLCQLEIGQPISLSLPAFCQLYSDGRQRNQPIVSLRPDNALLESKGTISYHLTTLLVSDIFEQISDHDLKIYARAISDHFPDVCILKPGYAVGGSRYMEPALLRRSQRLAEAFVDCRLEQM
jgi:hypothetical protein